jgi:membrane-bound lytic murein transglycosylase F
MMAPLVSRSRQLFLCLLAALLASCTRLDPPEASGELVVAVLDDPVFYQAPAGDSDASGFEYELIRSFAESAQLRLRIVPVATPVQLHQLLTNGRVHLAAGMAVQQAPDLRFAPPLREARLLLVQHADSVPLDRTGELADRSIEMLAGSLAGQAVEQFGAPPAAIIPVHAGNEIDLLARVAERRADLVATDSAHFDVAVNYYPDLAVARELPGRVAYAWAFRRDDLSLHARAELFIGEVRQDGRLARLFDRYFGHIKRIRAIEAAQLLEDIRTRLPHYREEFSQAGTVTGIDWRLLAALAYQESRWDPAATSPTGVRGMMMLTEETADRLGVGNRLDARESIRAGARYLADLMDRLPAEVAMPDRLWLALAAYNLGMGHLNGARQFAAGLKRDPASWYDMKTVLPLLARPEYYSRLKSGRARGGEAVILVENVRTYFDIIARFEPPPGLPTAQTSAMR